MANVSVFNLEGNEVGTLELNDAVFGVEVNEHLVHMAVVAQLANKRQGTQKAKTRSEVPAVVRNRGDRKVPDMQDRFNKSSAVDRWWSSIRSGTERLLFQDQQKREKSSFKIRSDIQSRGSEICCFR